MNKFVKIVGIASIVGLVALAGAVAAVFAQAPTVGVTPTPGGYGPGGMMGGGGHMGGNLMYAYRDLMHAPIAEALGMTLDEFNTAIDAGQTPFTLAETKGVEVATLQAAMQTGMANALKQAVTDGVVTQAQADQMLAHHAQMQVGHATGGGMMNQPGHGMGNGYGHGHMGNGYGPRFNAPVATPAPNN